MRDFDPKAHIKPLPIKNRQGEKIGERPYMNVESRLQWLDADRDRYTVSTSIVELTADWAVVRAEIVVLSDAGEVLRRAEAHRTCTSKRWGDYLEKAETGAVGRALVMLGYGTGSAGDFEEADDPPAPGPAPRKPAAPKPPAPGFRSRDEAEERAEAEQAARREARQAAQNSDTEAAAAKQPAAEQAPDTRPLAERLAVVAEVQREGPEPTPAQFVEALKVRGIPVDFAKGGLGIRAKYPLEIDHVQSWVTANPRRSLRAELVATVERWNKALALERAKAKEPAGAA